MKRRRSSELFCPFCTTALIRVWYNSTVEEKQMMSEPNPPENPSSANEHAHAFADAIQDVDGVEYARVKRGSFSVVSYVQARITLDMDEERIAELATKHGATNMDTDSVLKRVTFTFSRGDV